MSYQIIDEKIIGNKISSSGDFMQIKVVHIVCDTAASVPEPLPEWAAGSRCDVLADSGNVYILSISGEWKQVNFYNRGGSGGGFDPDNYYTKSQTDSIISGKVDKVTGKGLSTEDYTTSEKTKLSGIANNATNVGKLYPNSTNGEVFNSYSGNRASGNYSHAEGSNCTASGNYSHAEGSNCIASGNYSHAEGLSCIASKNGSHAEGYSSTASGTYSHASGQYTIANATAQTAIGRYNASDDNGTYAFIIGNGSNTNARNNAFAVDWNGLIYVGNSPTGVDVTNLVEKEQGKGLSTEDFTTAEKTKLSGIEAGANKITVDSALNSASTNPVQNNVVSNAIAGKVGKDGCLTLANIFRPNDNNGAQLGSYSYRFNAIYGTDIYGNNLYLSTPLGVSSGGTGCTSLNDFKTALNLGTAAEKSYTTSVTSESLDVITSGAVYTGLADKVDKVTGKGLSTEDYTTDEKNKLAVLSELNTATVTIDLNSQTWTESANGLFYTGNISVTNLYRALSALITGFSALKPTDNVAVIANSDKTAIRLTASTNTFSNQANITVSVFGRFTSS